MARGTVREVWRFPVKSLRGEPLEAAELAPDGVAGDRAPGEQHDLPGSVLLTTEASLVATEEALGRPLDLRRFRPNLHLDLDAPAYAEEGWEGGTMRFEGGVVMRLLHPCERCVIPTRDPDDGADRWPELLKWLARERSTLFGINARVLTPGVVRRGERVAVA